MSQQDYFMSLNWRQVKFHLARPNELPSYDETVAPSKLAYFLPSWRIDDVLQVRNWLYRAAVRYRLLGHYIARECQGIVIEFECVDDLALFEKQWQPVSA
jgi:hypothetical protein